MGIKNLDPATLTDEDVILCCGYCNAVKGKSHREGCLARVGGRLKKIQVGEWRLLEEYLKRRADR